MSRKSKLAELRRKTDLDLLILVKRELNRGLALAEVAATKESPFFEQAERTYQIVNALLPLVSGLNRDERRALESRLKELRSVLDRVRSERLQRDFATVSSS